MKKTIRDYNHINGGINKLYIYCTQRSSWHDVNVVCDVTILSDSFRLISNKCAMQFKLSKNRIIYQFDLTRDDIEEFKTLATQHYAFLSLGDLVMLKVKKFIGLPYHFHSLEAV